MDKIYRLSLILTMGISLFSPLDTYTLAQGKPPKVTAVLQQLEKDSRGTVAVKWNPTIHPNLEQQLFHRPMHPAISRKQAIRRAKGLIPRDFVDEPVVESYYLPTRPGIPLIYSVKLQYQSPNKTTLTLIHSLTGRIIDILVL